MIFYETIKSDKTSENNSVIVTEFFFLITCLNENKELLFPSNLCRLYSKSLLYRVYVSRARYVYTCILRAWPLADGHVLQLYIGVNCYFLLLSLRFSFQPCVSDENWHRSPSDT